MIFLMALSSQVIAWLMVNQALGELSVSVSSIILVGQPVVSTLLGIVLLKEIPGILQLGGGVLCLIGIYTVQRWQE